MLKFHYQTSAKHDSLFFKNENQSQKLKAFKKTINRKENGFFNYTEDKSKLERTKNLAKKYAHKKHFVQIGIGGSALGPKMLLEALGDFTTKSFTLLDNIDSDYIHRELLKINLKESLFYVVSKSGGTAETIAIFSLVRNLLKEKGVSPDDFNKYFVFCSDPKTGQLREYIEKYNFDSLEVPSNIGGRFSVLTDVGMFPAYFFEIDPTNIFEGAESFKKEILSQEIEKNDFLKTAATLAELYFNHTPSVDQTVLMPYSSLLKDFSSWFVQLWAESLGKESYENRSAVGLTPIPAFGATDQHSQVQLFMEGPTNKLIFLIEIEKRKYDFPLDSGLDLASGSKLSNFSLNQLMEAETRGTIKALKQNDKHTITISIPKLDEKALGALVIFFESLTVLMGEYLKVDPFNQPGVEQGKLFAFEYLDTL